MLAMKPAPRRRRNRIPSICGPEGFQPDEPIRVHLAADDDLEAGADAGHVEGDREPVVDENEGKVKVPPPAYGLWRSSVVGVSLVELLMFELIFVTAYSARPTALGQGWQ